MPIYKLWLHVEVIRQTKYGDIPESLDDEFLPIQIGEYSTKKKMEEAYYEYDQITGQTPNSNTQNKL